MKRIFIVQKTVRTTNSATKPSTYVSTKNCVFHDLLGCIKRRSPESRGHFDILLLQRLWVKLRTFPSSRDNSRGEYIGRTKTEKTIHSRKENNGKDVTTVFHWVICVALKGQAIRCLGWGKKSGEVGDKYSCFAWVVVKSALLPVYLPR